MRYWLRGAKPDGLHWQCIWAGCRNWNLAAARLVCVLYSVSRQLRGRSSIDFDFLAPLGALGAEVLLMGVMRRGVSTDSEGRTAGRLTCGLISLHEGTLGRSWQRTFSLCRRRDGTRSCISAAPASPALVWSARQGAAMPLWRHRALGATQTDGA